MIRLKVFGFGMAILFIGSVHNVSAQDFLNKIKKTADIAGKTAKQVQPQPAEGDSFHGSKINVSDVFREAAPLLQIAASKNVDKVISQTFDGENRIVFNVPGNLGMSTEGTVRVNGEAKVFPTNSGGGLFAVTYTACTKDNMCDNQFQLILIENNQSQLATGVYLASIYTPNSMVAELLKANKNYKKTLPANLKPNVNFAGNKLNYVVDCPDGVCQNSFVVRSFSFDGKAFVESR